MTPTPTGRIIPTESGRDLVLERSFRAPIEDVWASITESERTARWFGSWSGEAGPGKTVELRMTMEGEVPPTEVLIESCEPPRHLVVRTRDASGSWHLEATLREEGGVTTLTFIHHLDAEAEVENVGPGWEYYLDVLAASRQDGALPEWDVYYPAQSAHYRRL